MYRAEATVTIFANGKPIRTFSSQGLTLQLSSGVPVFLVVALALAIPALLVLLALILRREVDRRRTVPVPVIGRTGSVA
jgi:hypothetical protein